MIRLHDGPPPGSENGQHVEGAVWVEGLGADVLCNVVDPTLTVFAPEPGAANGAAVIINPGGGFHLLAW